VSLPAPPEQHAVADAALHEVIARIAMDAVAAVLAGDAVVARPAPDPIEAAGAAEIVVPLAAVEHVVARAALRIVVAAAPVERVVARVAQQGVGRVPRKRPCGLRKNPGTDDQGRDGVVQQGPGEVCRSRLSLPGGNVAAAGPTLAPPRGKEGAARGRALRVRG
jgi:hypothetical protein